MILQPPIAISLSPNTQKDDVWQAVKMLCQPWRWKEGEAIEKAEQWFKDYFRAYEAVSFNSGRSALMGLLKAFNVREGDEVLIQTFTCVAVPDPIIWVGAKPIFVDIDETLNLDPRAIEKHISPKTKAIIVQHTFGIPAKIQLIKKIAQKYNFILIEDCAHSLGATVKGKKLGTFGDAAFFSFGRDKVISSVFGGMAIVNSKSPRGHPTQNSKLRRFQKDLLYPGYFWIFQQLLHPIAFAVILPLYNLIIGKILLFALQKLKLLSFPVDEIEKRGGKPSFIPAGYPNALAYLLLPQLKKLNQYNNKRRATAKYYFKELKGDKAIGLPEKQTGAIYLRFNILVDDAARIISRAKKQGIILGNWYKNIVDPNGVSQKKIGYKLKSCPGAEAMAKLSVNLPTYPRLTLADLNRIVKQIRQKL